jgi:hypothetical protein
LSLSRQWAPKKTIKAKKVMKAKKAMAPKNAMKAIKAKKVMKAKKAMAPKKTIKVRCKAPGCKLEAVRAWVPGQGHGTWFCKHHADDAHEETKMIVIPYGPMPEPGWRRTAVWAVTARAALGAHRAQQLHGCAQQPQARAQQPPVCAQYLTTQAYTQYLDAQAATGCMPGAKEDEKAKEVVFPNLYYLLQRRNRFVRCWAFDAEDDEEREDLVTEIWRQSENIEIFKMQLEDKKKERRQIEVLMPFKRATGVTAHAATGAP